MDSNRCGCGGRRPGNRPAAAPSVTLPKRTCTPRRQQLRARVPGCDSTGPGA